MKKIKLKITEVELQMLLFFLFKVIDECDHEQLHNRMLVACLKELLQRTKKSILLEKKSISLPEHEALALMISAQKNYKTNNIEVAIIFNSIINQIAIKI